MTLYAVVIADRAGTEETVAEHLTLEQAEDLIQEQSRAEGWPDRLIMAVLMEADDEN